MHSLTTLISSDPLTAARNQLTLSLHQALSTQKPVLLLVSGGSSLKLLDSLTITASVSNLTLAPLDERFSSEPHVNNMAQITHTNFYAAVEKKIQIIDTRLLPNESQNELAERFNRNLNVWFKANPQGIVIATIGIGPDGHISGIMPYPEDPAFFQQQFENLDSSKLVTAYNAGNKNEFPLRVTTTLPCLRKITVGIVYAVGENKRDALHRIQAKAGSLAETPARVILEIPETYVFTDLDLHA
jgi:6-phosphogluconolactonase/glucosamine-6-phosphate isomerase/deaminase